MFLDPWQQFILQTGLGERADQQWSAFEVACIVSRQQGKGAIFEALALAKLVLFESQLFIYSSHEFKTSREAFRRIGALIDNTPELSSRVLRTVRNPSEFGYDFRQGQRLRFFARSGGSGRGWSADDLFFDEAFKLGGSAMAALLPTLSTRPNPQVWYTSSAALSDSEQLHALRRRALAGDSGRLAYLEWSAPDGADIHDRDAWAQANPALGYRLTEEYIASEVDAIPEAEFRRERLSIPDLPMGETVISSEAWRSCADPSSTAVDPVAFGIDVSPDRSRATISVAGMRADGKPHVAVVDSRSGTEWVVARAVEVTAKHPGVVGIDPAGPAGSLILDLEAAGVTVVQIKTRELTQTCGRIFDLVMSGDLRHRDEGLMNAAVTGARKRSVGDAWAWARKDVRTDITPLYAATVALWAHGNADTPIVNSVW